MGRYSLASLVVVAVLAGAPAGASGATTLGETFTPDAQCSANATSLQTTSPGAKYEAPLAGVITSWSFQAPATLVPDLKLKVARRAGGDNFTIIGESPLVASITGALNTFPVQIPVLAGDIIGLHAGTGGNCSDTNVPGYGMHFTLSEAALGSTRTFVSAPQVKIDVSATLETTTCNGRAPTMAGTAGNDTLTGTPNADVILGLEGNDTISALAGEDAVCGGAGKDTLRGGAGKDKLLGEGGKDKLKGGGAKDLCKGGKGDDSADACEKERSI